MANLTERLTGTTWTLVSYESVDTEGNPLFPLGRDAKGYIVFDQTGLFSVQLMAADRSQALAEGGTARFQTQAEKQMAEYGYHAYAGRYVMDEANAVMTTTVELSLIPAYVGSRQQRRVNIEGDRLYLSNVQHPERKLVWERVADAQG